MHDYQTMAELFTEMGNELYSTNFPVPPIYYNLKGHCAGQALLNKWEIRLNKAVLDAQNEEEAYDTVGHEIAHLFAYKVYNEPNHGLGWKKVMVDFGLKPQRCHNYNTTPARQQRKWDYACSCRKHSVSTTCHNRIQKGKQFYRCRVCKSELVKIP